MPHEPHFYGRADELRQLHQWAVAEQRRMIAIFGAGGQGKTALTVHFVRTLAEAQSAAADLRPKTLSPSVAATPPFERIIWRSLLTAPPLTAILQDWLQQLSAQQVVTLPRTIEQQFTLLYDYIQQQRFLLVLDNVESILLDDGSGACRPGYEAYEQLWQIFIQRDHRCCLLLTSRERPRVFTSHEEQLGLLRTMLLDGLALSDGQALLRDQGISSEAPASAALVQLYSGNPLALKLVADTVTDLFAGNVAAFLQEETPFFADIGAVLDQQFSRLSSLEIELLTWLALEQEPVTSQTLWENLAAPPAKREFLAALRTLVRRSLMQRQGEFFSLQNVILEYTCNRLVNLVGAELTTDWVTRLAQAEGPGGKTSREQAPATPPATSPPAHFLLWSTFNRYALLKAHAPEYVRDAQRRLLLAPVAHRLQQVWGFRIAEQSQQLLAALRSNHRPQSPLAAGYAAANLFHLLFHLNHTVEGYDFSHLTLRQASLRAATLPALKLAGAQLLHCDFTDAFMSITTLVFHPAGDQVIGGAINGKIYTWRLAAPTARPQPNQPISGHGQSIFGMAISPDGAMLASSGLDQRTFVWALPTYRLLYTITETKKLCAVAGL